MYICIYKLHIYVYIYIYICIDNGMNMHIYMYIFVYFLHIYINRPRPHREACWFRWGMAFLFTKWEPTTGDSFGVLLGMEYLPYTPPKFNIDTKDHGLENVSPFICWLFCVSMLNFRGVKNSYHAEYERK